jgi:hypothetical protein
MVSCILTILRGNKESPPLTAAMLELSEAFTLSFQRGGSFLCCRSGA